MGTTAGEFIQALTKDHDVIVIGGLAVIAHGFNRPTKDANVWLDPMESPASWADAIQTTCARFPDIKRYVDWQTCEAALENPDPPVKEIAMRYLREFAAEGDPFSTAILEEREIPPP